MTLLVGSLPPPLTGQSISFSYLTNLTKKSGFRIYNTNKTPIKFFNYLDSLLFLPIYLLFNQFDSIYFLGSRSKLGFLRQLPFLAIAISKRIKIINHLHGADFKDFFIKAVFLKSIIKWVYENIEISIVLLEEMKDQFKAFPKMKLEVVPNAVGKEFNNLDVSFPKEKRIIFLSNIMASKGIIEFMTASKQLLTDDNSIKIDIAGDFIGDYFLTKNQMIRIVKLKNNSFEIDSKAQGRGAYILKDNKAITRVIKNKVLHKTFRTNVPNSAYEELKKIIK